MKTVFLLFYQVMHLRFWRQLQWKQSFIFYDVVTIHSYSNITSWNFDWYKVMVHWKSMHTIMSSEKTLNNFDTFLAAGMIWSMPKFALIFHFPVTWTSSNCASFSGSFLSWETNALKMHYLHQTVVIRYSGSLFKLAVFDCAFSEIGSYWPRFTHTQVRKCKQTNLRSTFGSNFRHALHYGSITCDNFRIMIIQLYFILSCSYLHAINLVG